MWWSSLRVNYNCCCLVNFEQFFSSASVRSLECFFFLTIFLLKLNFNSDESCKEIKKNVRKLDFFLSKNVITFFVIFAWLNNLWTARTWNKKTQCGNLQANLVLPQKQFITSIKKKPLKLINNLPNVQYIELRRAFNSPTHTHKRTI